jgi:HD-like signal output (HDOD) protein
MRADSEGWAPGADMDPFKRRFANIAELLDHVDNICPFPAAAQRLIALTNDDNSSVEAIVGSLASDPALAAQVLRVANSAEFYRSGAERPRDLRQAVVTVGRTALRTMASSMALLASFATRDQLSLDLQAQSAACGAIAAIAAPMSPAEGRGLPFICGLLCEVGALACLAVDGPGYLELRMRTISVGSHGSVNAAIAREGLEVMRYGFPARSIGAQLLRRHHLPEQIASAIGATPRQLPHAPLLHRATAFARILAPVVVRARGVSDAALTEEVRGVARCTSLVELDTAELVRRCLSAAAKVEQSLRAARALP